MGVPSARVYVPGTTFVKLKVPSAAVVVVNTSLAASVKVIVTPATGESPELKLLLASLSTYSVPETLANCWFPKL